MATQRDQNQELKYLGFFKVAAAYSLVCLSNLYEFAKENAGPLRFGMKMIEGTVKSVISPVYEKFNNVPSPILFFVDNKMEETIGKLSSYLPPSVEHALSEARSLSSDVQRNGFLAAGKDAYAKYEPAAEKYAVKGWCALNQLPLFPQVAEIVVPTAMHWSDKYNYAVMTLAMKGYGLFVYLPLVPVERIAKAFERAEGEKEGAENVEGASPEGSD